jgi:hypothetical protein
MPIHPHNPFKVRQYPGAVIGRVNFIRVEIETGYTMLDLARTERLLLQRRAARQAIPMHEKPWTAPSDSYLC